MKTHLHRYLHGLVTVIQSLKLHKCLSQYGTFPSPRSAPGSSLPTGATAPLGSCTTGSPICRPAKQWGIGAIDFSTKYVLKSENNIYEFFKGLISLIFTIMSACALIPYGLRSVIGTKNTNHSIHRQATFEN